MLGGQVRQGSPDLVGPATTLMLERLTADVAFLGSEGIDPARGSFAQNFETAEIARRMAAASRRVVVVADGSKVGRPGNVLYAPIGEIDELITDRSGALATVRVLRRKGVAVTLV